MEGYDATTYGDRFADVYDDWYADVSDVAVTCATLARLAGRQPTEGAGNEPLRVLELGVGTGRIAVPLALANGARMHVVGIDSSRAMLARLRERDPTAVVETIEADMVTGLPDGPFDLVFVAYNTLFNLVGDGEQEACFTHVAERLAAGARFAVEAFVPDMPAPRGDHITIRSMTVDRVVLSISRHSGADGRAEGQFVELTDGGGVRLRPWAVRAHTPDQLDAIAAGAGLTLEARWEDMAGTAFGESSTRHVSVYRKPAPTGV